MTSINPGLRVVRRGGQSLQIGLGAGGLILSGLQRSEVTFVEELHRGIPDEQVMKRAAALGVDSLRAQEICGMLSGLLFPDAQVHAHGFKDERLLPERSALLGLYRGAGLNYLEQRAQLVVQLTGLGRTGAVTAAILAGSGVGTLLLEDDSPVTASDVGPGSFRVDDIGVPRSLAVRRHLQRIDPENQAHVVRSGSTGGLKHNSLDLAIVTGHDAVSSTMAARFLVAEKPHLFVLIREQDATVGPLVIPGETACSECVERHRSSNDREWLDICEQLSSSAEVVSGQRPQPKQWEGLSLSMTVAGTAAAHALLLLDGVNRPSSWSAVLTFHADDGCWTRREFTTHPDCGCQWQSQSLATISNTDSP